MTDNMTTNTRRQFIRYGVATAAGAAAAKILPRSLNVARADEAGVGAGQSRAGLISSAPATTFKEGVAKINVDERSLLWIWTHRITDWLRLWFWTWWP